MRDPHSAIASTLSRTCLASVMGGSRAAPDAGGGSSSSGQPADKPVKLAIPKSTVGVRPEDCGPAGPAWTVQLHGTRRVQGPFFGVDVPYTVQATQCK